ncbi:MAG: 2-succinyl-5-enolpyruvyl-6-hydroxy-3-cyclohexene-1-carboxylic-acid synthase [Prevotella sp.]|uniref:2-succinyl-5-enolpyruvyl-6-hydroxy-3-cyclohexene-1-carboxylate synthase n=1 Tax=Segatella cerevisiae TaxID=2053716 RepID=A0ABT1BTM8_9BACT|nr:2-succinyl-5-enolpyruvyl-6-hydroxy-3-cyclohexene-1-carboxylic-acid synthase [Segatella cerevisiae]MCH3995546.1 2-succinyl-5-enolpyruvyl-6-hydroxy-3-cyclohexene-1-carboxylic-acid synthase [Prevotella sp.]MCI1245984.1 2-succinyl-5-enolpyruvyl-6-hydroxy-3-cyclohexene-1-carboxylic-acid synthase [Prevotella sp.]MCO6024436.1 2-succinyl-5-enolpyruvyl-6-hydroxy-3-cyclohexene-1-carboxylic-acid synthase [Segatella cerevisiae]
MYSNKENVNILTDLLVKHGVRHAVVCPGSRNSPIVHNLEVCPSVSCYPCTDERSAGFYALGMCQYTHGPVVVCVTSGSALLDLLPSVAEACYQHQRLIVVSADRPIQWIDQLDGQTIPQEGALGKFVLKSVSLPEPGSNEESHWYCNRLVNEALLASSRHGGGPVHINVPITEPLYEYTVKQLPEERLIRSFGDNVSPEGRDFVIERFLQARRPMVVIGQDAPSVYDDLQGSLQVIADYGVLLDERLSVPDYNILHFEEILSGNKAPEYQPDFLVFMGYTLVSKSLKVFLRADKDLETWRIASDDPAVYDTFKSLRGIVQTDTADFLKHLAEAIGKKPKTVLPFHETWKRALDNAENHAAAYEPAYSEMAVVKCFEEQLEDIDYDYQVQYGNSNAVRIANIFAGHHVWCNRGVNGIDGSLSTAAGMSVVCRDQVFCVLGDLSFFYDANALWNQNLKGNFRIILMNNGGGAIFNQFEGLRQSPAREKLVRGDHQTMAKGLCTQNDIGYLQANGMEDMQAGIVQLLTRKTNRPMLLEVFTDSETDIKVYQAYFKSCLSSCKSSEPKDK